MTRLRVVVLLLLLAGAYWAALPWIDCARAMYPFGGGLQLCTVGFTATHGGPQPQSPNSGGFPDRGFGLNLTDASLC